MIQHLSAEIVRTATHLFATRGYAGSSIRAIARLTRVDVATVYYHHRSKEGLLRSALAPLLTAVAFAISAADALPDDRERRKELIRSLIAIQAEHFEAVTISTDRSVNSVEGTARTLHDIDKSLIDRLAAGTTSAHRADAHAALAAIRSYSPVSVRTASQRESAAKVVEVMLTARQLVNVGGRLDSPPRVRQRSL